MVLIFSVIISFLVSLMTCIVFFRMTKKKSMRETNAQGLESNGQAGVPEKEKNDSVLYHSEPIKDYAFNNFFTDDPAFLKNMKAMLEASFSTPIILRGPTGIGKTHMMHAFENYLLERNPTMKTYFISAEAFTSEFIESIKNKKINEFKAKYKNLDALFIDDLNFLEHKEATQEELCFTISELLKKNAFICFGLTTPFLSEEALSNRLWSLIKGIQIDVPIPGFDAKRMKIMQIFADSKCYINGDLVDYLAKPEYSLNELVGLCKRLILMKQLDGKGCVNLEIDDIKPLLN